MKAKTWWETVFKILTENDLNFSTQPNFFGGPWGGSLHHVGLQKEIATHPSTLAWKIPWTEEPGGLEPKGLQRVRHD